MYIANLTKINFTMSTIIGSLIYAYAFHIIRTTLTLQMKVAN